MRFKNLSDFPFGTKLSSLEPPAPDMVVIVRGRFDLVHDGVARLPEGLAPLVQGALSADAFAEGDDERAGELVYPSDFADFKPRADVMLAGSFHPPTSRAIRECPVTFAVGNWNKRLRVVGSRSWSATMTGLTPSEPAHLGVLPLTYRRAYGGPGYPQNPVGLGCDGAEVPNLELPDAPVIGRSEKSVPACFAPINPAWAPRAGRVGEAYGASYKARAPYFAEDFDFGYFNAAPLDQQLPFLRGDELLVLTNMHATHRELRCRLPSLRVRAFVNDVKGAFRELTMLLDTLFVEVDKGQLCLTWRGRTRVADAEFDDVTTVLIASEPLAAPLPLEHYRARLLKFERDPLALDEHIEDEAALAFFGAAAAEGEEQAKALAGLIERESPGAGEKLAAATGKDLTSTLAEAMNRAAADEAPPLVPVPGAPRMHLGLDSAAIADAAAQLRAVAPDEAEAFAEKMSDARFRSLDPNYRPPNRAAIADAALEPGAELSGRDFTDRDLSGIDLRGANLSGAIFTRAKLANTVFARANLEGALLFKADLGNADLSEASLARVNAAKATLVGARLAGASLDKAYVADAELSRAVLDGARGELVFFTRARLSDASLRNIELRQSDFEDAELTAARVMGAKLERCLFYKARARRARFADATLSGCTFEESDLREATFTGARAERCNWTRATLEGADCRWAHLPWGFFDRVNARGARFDCAVLEHSRFFKAQLDEASFAQAKLVSADLSKCTMNGARFTGANLYDAKLLGARGRDCDFSGANLKRALHDSA